MNIHRALVLGLIGLVLLGAALIIMSIWGIAIDATTLWKLLATIGVLILLLGFLLVVKSDFAEHKRLKDENYLD